MAGPHQAKLMGLPVSAGDGALLRDMTLLFAILGLARQNRLKKHQLVFQDRDRMEVSEVTELDILLLAKMVGAMCGLCNAFPKIVVNCCLQLPESQSRGCSARNGCSRSVCRGSGMGGVCETYKCNDAVWLPERASAGPFSLPTICKAKKWKACSIANR